MKFKLEAFQNAKVGNTILGRRYSKTIKGVVLKKLPGALLVETKTGSTVMIDADRVAKVYK